MTSIATAVIEADDPTAARAFHEDAFGPDLPIAVRAAGAPTSGFRGFTLSLLVAQPADVDRLFRSAVRAGAATLKPAARSMWGYGGVVQAPDGTIWKIATPAKKDTGPVTGRVEQVVLLLGVDDVAASRRFYVDRGFAVAKSFLRTYVEFEPAGGRVTLGLYKRRALAKDAGVAPAGTGAHRLAIAADAEPFTDPDGFAWETAHDRAAALA